MLIWFVITWATTVFLTVAAASMYWSIDKTPWRGLFTALSMAFAGIIMLLLYRLVVTPTNGVLLAKVLYTLCTAQALAQTIVAATIRRRQKRAIMNNV